MTDDRSLERAARTFIEVGPSRAPDQAVEAALLQIQTTPQERDFRVPWRFPSMNPTARLAVVAATVLVAAGTVFAVLRPPSNSGLTPPSPTATVAPSGSGPLTSYAPLSFPPTPVPSVAVPGTTTLREGDSLFTGVTYSPSKFTPQLSLAGTTGWFLRLEHPDSLWFTLGSDASVYDMTPQIEILRPSGVLPTFSEPLPTPAPLPADLIGWLRTRTDLVLGPSTSVTVGGVVGTAVDGSDISTTSVNSKGFMHVICAASMASCVPAGYAIGFGVGRPFRLIVQQVHGQTVAIALNTGGSTSDFNLLEGFIAGLHWVGAP